MRSRVGRTSQLCLRIVGRGQEADIRKTVWEVSFDEKSPKRRQTSNESFWKHHVQAIEHAKLTKHGEICSFSGEFDVLQGVQKVDIFPRLFLLG